MSATFCLTLQLFFWTFDKHLIPPVFARAGDMDRTMVCKWHRDSDAVVLEIQESQKKSTSDSDMCSWRELLRELEEEGLCDVTINSHELVRGAASEDGSLSPIRGSFAITLATSFQPSPDR